MDFCISALRFPRYNLAGFHHSKFVLPELNIAVPQPPVHWQNTFLDFPAVTLALSRLQINPLDLLLSSLSLTSWLGKTFSWNKTNTTKKSQMIYLIDWSIDLSRRGPLKPWSGDV